MPYCLLFKVFLGSEWLGGVFLPGISLSMWYSRFRALDFRRDNTSDSTLVLGSGEPRSNWATIRLCQSHFQRYRGKRWSVYSLPLQITQWGRGRGLSLSSLAQRDRSSSGGHDKGLRHKMQRLGKESKRRTAQDEVEGLGIGGAWRAGVESGRAQKRTGWGLGVEGKCGEAKRERKMVRHWISNRPHQPPKVKVVAGLSCRGLR